MLKLASTSGVAIVGPAGQRRRAPDAARVKGSATWRSWCASAQYGRAHHRATSGVVTIVLSCAIQRLSQIEPNRIEPGFRAQVREHSKDLRRILAHTSAQARGPATVGPSNEPLPKARPETFASTTTRSGFSEESKARICSATAGKVNRSAPWEATCRDRRAAARRRKSILSRGSQRARPARPFQAFPRTRHDAHVREDHTTPRLGGRLPPPDQFNHNTLAMFILPRQSDDHTAGDGLGRTPVEPKIAPRRLPDVNVEGDDGAAINPAKLTAGVALALLGPPGYSGKPTRRRLDIFAREHRRHSEL